MNRDLPAPPAAAGSGRERPPLRGVNLGNWLLLERWMRPRLFAGLPAADEHALSLALGPARERVLREHRDSYVTGDDFRWLAGRGLNAVRLPFGYWHFAPEEPYVASPECIDRAIGWAEDFGLGVVLDLHGLPGGQSAEHHTGRAGHFRWPGDADCLARSLDVIELIAERYAGRRGVVAFSVVNEPDPGIGRARLVDFYFRSCERVRRHMAPEAAAFVLAASPEGELSTYHGCLGDAPSVWTDVHLYQSFGDWERWPLLDYLAYPLRRQPALRAAAARGPLIVGEWSLAMGGPAAREIEAMPPWRRDLLMRMHGNMQLALYEEFTGWFFWSYRVANRPHWSFRDAVERGWLPDSFPGTGGATVAHGPCSPG